MSTAGYEIEAHEVDALLANLLGDVLDEKDDLIRYQALTREQALFDALVSRIKRERGKILATMVEEERATKPAIAAKQAVAEAVGLGSRQRVEQLIARAHE